MDEEPFLPGPVDPIRSAFPHLHEDLAQMLLVPGL